MPAMVGWMGADLQLTQLWALFISRPFISRLFISRPFISRRQAIYIAIAAIEIATRIVKSILREREIAGYTATITKTIARIVRGGDDATAQPTPRRATGGLVDVIGVM
jgi:hypothetical protein